MSKFMDKTADEQSAILANVAKVYEEAGNPTWLQPPEIETAYVTVLMGNQQVEQGGEFKISGKAPSDAKESSEALKKAMQDATKGLSVELDIGVGYGVGSKFGGMQNVNKVMEEGECNVEHKEGEVLLVDFWATWCPPCQAPMAHNQEMLEKNAADWGGKVRIIGASIDNDAATVKNHVTSKNWTSPEHYHVRKQGCTASDQYGVRGVPHCLLVDTTGTIVWMGHPASRPDLVSDFNKLLKGEMPEGCSAGAAAAEEGAEGGAVKGMDDAAAQAQIAKFKEESKKLLENNPDAFKFPRAFLVLEDKAKFDSATKTFKHEFTCHKQVMGGTQEQQDVAKKLLADIKGEWETKEMFRL